MYKTTGAFLIGIGLLAAVAACDPIKVTKVQAREPAIVDNRRAPVIHTDTNGCQYIRFYGTDGLSARNDRQGNQICIDIN